LDLRGEDPDSSPASSPPPSMRRGGGWGVRRCDQPVAHDAPAKTRRENKARGCPPAAPPPAEPWPPPPVREGKAALTQGAAANSKSRRTPSPARHCGWRQRLAARGRQPPSPERGPGTPLARAPLPERHPLWQTDVGALAPASPHRRRPWLGRSWFGPP